jgi:hypothetical protein
VYTDNQEDKGVQIWEASSYLAENPFKETAKNKRTGERIAFADPDKGKTVTFTVRGKMTAKKIDGIVFEDRPDIISDEILDEAVNIEDFLEKPSVEVLEAIAKVVLGGGMDDREEEPDPPKRRRSTEPEPEPEPEPDEEDEKPAPRRKRPEPEPEPEPDEEDEKPAPRRKRPEPEEETPVPSTRRMRRRE